MREIALFFTGNTVVVPMADDTTDKWTEILNSVQVELSEGKVSVRSFLDGDGKEFMRLAFQGATFLGWVIRPASMKQEEFLKAGKRFLEKAEGEMGKGEEWKE